MNDLMDGLESLIEKAKADLDVLQEAKARLNGTPVPRVAAPAPKPKRTRRRQKRRGGTRADKCVALIKQKPGISARDLAKEMKMQPNYLYRVLGELEKEGRVKKDGKKYEVPVA